MCQDRAIIAESWAEEARMNPIEEFLAQVDWANDCQNCGSYLITPIAVLVPCHWSSVTGVLQQVKALAAEHDKKPGLILYGDDVPSSVIECLFWNLPKLGVHHHWLGSLNQVIYDGLVCDVLDGALPQILAESIIRKE